MSVFLRLESSHGGSYLECVSTSSGGSFTTHIGVSPSPSGVISLLLPQAFFIPCSFCLPFAPSIPFLFILLCLSFILVFTFHSSSHVLSIFAIYLHHDNHHIVFFSLPSRSEPDVIPIAKKRMILDILRNQLELDNC